MTITLTLPPELEARLQVGLTERNEEEVYAVLAASLRPLTHALLAQAAPRPSPRSRAHLEALAATFAAQGKVPPLSDHTMSRESIYEDLP